jgi:hypothetical protein
MKSGSIYDRLMSYLDDVINEEKQIKQDPYMFTRIMAGLEDQKQVVVKNKLQLAFQTAVFVVLIVAGIYSGILLGKNFTGSNTLSADYQKEVYFLDELQHENMISVFLTDDGN